ncbi:hypothetical protein BIW11_11249, partial [Tropilaelaps mercedesae]
IHLRMRGLGGVTSALSMLISRIINEDPWNVIPIAEAQMITFGREMLANQPFSPINHHISAGIRACDGSYPLAAPEQPFAKRKTTLIFHRSERDQTHGSLAHEPYRSFAGTPRRCSRRSTANDCDFCLVVALLTVSKEDVTNAFSNVSPLISLSGAGVEFVDAMAIAAAPSTQPTWPHTGG